MGQRPLVLSLGLARGRPTNPARDTNRHRRWKSQRLWRLVSEGSLLQSVIHARDDHTLVSVTC
jgi:hypothetical protein